MLEQEQWSGYCVFAEETAERPIQAVRAAAERAGLDPAKVRDIKARNAFIRTMGKLEREGKIVAQAAADGVLRHKLRDDEDLIVFQFSEYFVKSSGAEYDRAALIQFNKRTGQIVCSNASIRQMAEALFDSVQGVFKPSDINAFVARVVQAEGKRLHIRDAVYFMPVAKKELVEKLKKFFAALGFTYHAYPIAHSDENRQNLVKAAIKDMRQTFEQMQGEVSKLKLQKDEKGAPALTKRIARTRIKELKREMDQHREIVAALRGDVDTLLRDAGDAGEALIQAAMPMQALIQSVQKGRRLNGLVADLLEVSDESPELEVLVKAHRRAQAVDLSGAGSVPMQGVLFDAKPVKGVAVDVAR